MRRAGMVICALLLTGCRALLMTMANPPTFENHSAYPDQFFRQVWAETELLCGADISLDGIAVIVHEDAGAFYDACVDIEGLGCSDVDSINILGAVGTNAIDVGTEVAHQLGHVHLGGDGRHSHVEWFGEGGVVEQLRAMIVSGGAR
jgi:hypothetical protein